MPSETSSRYTPCPQNDTRQSAEVHPPYGNTSWPNGHQTGANYGGPFHGRNDASYGDRTQYSNNMWTWNEGLVPPPSVRLEGLHQGNPNIGYAPGNHQHYFATPGPPPVGHYVPSAHGIPNSGYAPPTAMPDVVDPFSQNIPNSDPSRTSAMEDLKRLANRYLHNPDSRVDTLRVGLSPSGRRFMVMIMVEVDDIV